MLERMKQKLLMRKKKGYMPIIYDTTLRDGAQQEGILLDVPTRLRIASKLDELGVDYIEGGWPGANPTDTMFFEQVGEFKNAKLVAFGSTRYRDKTAETDPMVQMLVQCKAPCVNIFGKTWDKQVTDILGVSLNDNIDMIKDTVHYLAKHKEVFFAAEHYFDGYKSNPEYAILCLEEAVNAGASYIVLCDTNGGTIIDEIKSIFIDTMNKVHCKLGIHLHNDIGMAVAASCTIASINPDIMIQGTINGIGERVGNADLVTIICNLMLKMDISCGIKLSYLKSVSDYVSEVTNVDNSKYPYVGFKAFTHKAGTHANAVIKWSRSYEHVDPYLVGNVRYLPLSDLSGKSVILYHGVKLGYSEHSINTMLPLMLKDLKERKVINDINAWYAEWLQ